MNFRIVPMTAAHLPQVAALEKVCFPADPWSAEVFRTAMECPGTVLLVAENEAGAVLGYAVLSMVLDEGNLDNIAVAPHCRSRGVADALLSALVSFDRTRLSVLQLEVRVSNLPAIALYEQHGFAPVGRRKNYYRSPREDALLMTLDLTEKGRAVGPFLDSPN